MTNEQTAATARETEETSVEAAFEIDDWEELTYDEPDAGPKMTRVTIRKTYRGDRGQRGS